MTASASWRNIRHLACIIQAHLLGWLLCKSAARACRDGRRAPTLPLRRKRTHALYVYIRPHGVSGVTRGGEKTGGGQLPPGTGGEGCKQFHQHIL